MTWSNRIFEQKSEADLLQEYQDTLDFRLELMDWRQSRDGTVGTPYIRELLRQFEYGQCLQFTEILSYMLTLSYSAML